MRRFFFITVLLLGFVVPLHNALGQFSKEGPQVETFYSVIDDSEQPYALYLPKNFDADKTYPLVIMLHGAGSNHRLALKRAFGKSNLPGENDVEASRYFPEWKDEQYIVAAPYARGTMGYQGIPEDDVMQVIEECLNNFNIDENRVFLTGLSMGGGGTLYIGLANPDIFAAIAPVCPAPPADAYDLMGNALNLPVAIFQGGADGLVRPEGSRGIVKELADAGTLVEYSEFPGVGHNVWENAYEDGNIFKWFDGIERNPFPQRVRYTTKWYKYNSAYWVLIDRLNPGTLANIDIQFKSENVVDARISNIEAFTLTLKGHGNFNASRPLNISINGQQITSTPKFNHSFTLINGKWTAEKYNASATSKQKGLEGPMAEAIYDRHVYVYGTAGDPSQEELAERMAQARAAANFAGGIMGGTGAGAVNPRVISDKQIRDSDYATSNLILFGTKETNLVIERFSDRLPIQLNADAKDFGLAYCFPINGNYIVVSSGIPFWTTPPPLPRTATAAPATPPAAPARTVVNFGGGSGARALIGLGDFLLFKENNGNVISSGYFDNEWNIPADELSKLKASGVIIVVE